MYLSDNDRRAQASYDAMLARGPHDDGPEFDANDIMEGLVIPEGKTRVDVAVNLSAHMELDSGLEFFEEDGVLMVDAQGHLEDVEAGREDGALSDLIGELEALGYLDHTAITIETYEEKMEDVDDYDPRDEG